MRIGKTKVLRVVIVEDEILVAMGFAYMVRELGHIVVAVATRLNQAIAFAESAEIVLVKPHGIQEFQSALNNVTEVPTR